MIDKNKQRGASMPATLLFIAMTAIILTVAFKLYPAFYENWQISSVIQSFEEENKLKNMSAKDIARMFDKRLTTNNVHNFNSKEYLIIELDEEGVYIGVEYEVRVPIYKNVDAVAKFDESMEKNF